MESYAGNPGATANALLAANYKGTTAMGEAFRQANEYNSVLYLSLSVLIAERVIQHYHHLKSIVLQMYVYICECPLLLLPCACYNLKVYDSKCF